MCRMLSWPPPCGHVAARSFFRTKTCILRRVAEEISQTGTRKWPVRGYNYHNAPRFPSFSPVIGRRCWPRESVKRPNCALSRHLTHPIMKSWSRRCVTSSDASDHEKLVSSLWKRRVETGVCGAHVAQFLIALHGRIQPRKRGPPDSICSQQHFATWSVAKVILSSFVIL